MLRGQTTSTHNGIQIMTKKAAAKAKKAPAKKPAAKGAKKK